MISMFDLDESRDEDLFPISVGTVTADELIDEFEQQKALDREIEEIIHEETHRKPATSSRKSPSE